MCFQLKIYERDNALIKASSKTTNITKQNGISKHHEHVSVHQYLQKKLSVYSVEVLRH